MTEDGGVSIGPTLETLEQYEGDFVERVDKTDPNEPKPEPKTDGKPEAKKYAGKYDLDTELEKAYLEGQRKITELSQKLAEMKPKEEPKADDKPAEGDPKPEDKPKEGEEAPKEDPKTTAESKPVDFVALNAEFAEKGELSAESLASLEKAGIPPEAAGLFFAGVEAIQTLRANEVHSLAGSKEAYDSLVEWGSKNLSEAERNAFDGAVDKAILEGDTSALKLLVPGIQARMKGDGPEYVTTKPTGGASAIKPFATLSEQSAAIQDRRYGRDAAYTREVEKRIEISNF